LKKHQMDDPRKPHSLIVFLASGFGSGYFPVVPGTAGTIVGVLLYWLLSHLSSFLYVVTGVTFVFLAAWIAERAAQRLQQKDPPCIVIDEVAGYLVTMILIPWDWLYIGLGFAAFRLFDIAKPFPIRHIDARVPGGWGIVLDDVLAGVYANIVLQVVIHWI
jgi:phosphatidylglycerophosphatase A